jgi:membrane protease YdiL (CAAX protease family)
MPPLIRAMSALLTGRPLATSATTRSHHFIQLATVTTLLGIFVAVMPARDAVQSGVWPKLFLLGRMALLVLLCTWFLRASGDRWADVGLRRPRRWWVVPLTVAGGFVLLVAVSTLMMRLILPAIGAIPPQPGARAIRGDLAEYLFWAVPVAWGSAAFGEELVVRGFLLDRITKVIGSSGARATGAAVVVQAALFGAFHFHQGVGGALVTGAVGLVLGVIWLAGRRNLWPCILLHGLVDFVSYTQFYTAGSGA